MPGEKDVTEKILEDYNDVFADIANNLLFGGREVISPEELETAQAVSQMKLEDGLHEQERDCVKHWKQGTIILAAIGYENQSTADQVMPLRTVSYDGGVYRTQVNRYNRERRQRVPHAPLYPAVTLVLYYGEKPWSGPRSLRECFPDLHPELEGLIPDYPLHLVEIARLTPEQVKGFKSDFRFIADYLVQMKNGGYDAAVAFDGDADRCLAIDENGNIVDGDRLIAIISDDMKNSGKLSRDTAVVTVMSNLGFHTYMKEHGINTVCTSVGDRYVLEEMLSSGYNIGGEQSGHIIFLDHATTGDGQLTAVKLISLLRKTGKKLSELTAEFTDYPQLLLNVKITEDKKGFWDKNNSILAAIKEAKDALGDDGRVLVRESGTEPLVRVMIEGKDAEKVELYTKRIADTVRKELGNEN